jgi:hypothetical protein
MENQVNIDNQNSQQIRNNPVSQPVQVTDKHGLNYWMISTFILATVLVVSLTWFYIGSKTTKNNENTVPKITYNQDNSPTPTQKEVIKDKNMPSFAVFMREGAVYLKNFGTNQETKISKTTKVSSPNLSPNGKYVIYFSIIHAGGGFPRGDVFIADSEGKFEKNLGSTNEFVSRATWSKDGNYLGIILYSDESPDNSGRYTTFPAEILLFDASLQKEVVRTNIKSDQPLPPENNQYNLNLNCDSLEIKYMSFCYEYTAIVGVKQSTPEWNYKADQYRNSSFTKTGYKLTKSYKINNDLVVLEYYTGEPRNPESQWGIAGGVFVPGYDEGVTQTYTVLLTEMTNKAVVEIPNAVDTKFLF